jgi:hypothetical protein
MLLPVESVAERSLGAVTPPEPLRSPVPEPEAPGVEEPVGLEIVPFAPGRLV